MKSKVFLAPMAEVTEAAFRILCSNYGAGLTYTEMISSTALARSGENKLFDVQPCEKPIAVQLMGANLEDISKAVKLVEDRVDYVDFNLGCPMKKIVDSGAGAALLKKPALVRKICKVLVKGKKPASMKIRSGWDDKSINALKIAKIACGEGISMICVHPKTRMQLKGGEPSWEIIKQVKESVKIPVIGNGGINCPEDASRMFSEIGCDYVMVGRAASKNPYIFKQCLDYFSKKSYSSPDLNNIFLEYLKLADRYNSKFKYIRDHSIYFTKGIKGGAKLREEISKAKDIGALKKIILPK